MNDIKSLLELKNSQNDNLLDGKSSSGINLEFYQCINDHEECQHLVNHRKGWLDRLHSKRFEFYQKTKSLMHSTQREEEKQSEISVGDDMKHSAKRNKLVNSEQKNEMSVSIKIIPNDLEFTTYPLLKCEEVRHSLRLKSVYVSVHRQEPETANHTEKFICLKACAR